MKSQLLIDDASDVPIYQQIVDHLEKAILTGAFIAGDYLPSVRDFAMKNQVNPNTVSKAYQILQNLGLAETVRGLGLRVCTLNHQSADKRKREILLSSIDSLISTGISLQISQDLLLQEVKARVQHYFSIKA